MNDPVILRWSIPSVAPGSMTTLTTPIPLAQWECYGDGDIRQLTGRLRRNIATMVADGWGVRPDEAGITYEIADDEDDEGEPLWKRYADLKNDT